MYIFRLLFKIFWLIMFITGCSGSSGNNYVGGSGAPEVGTNLVVTASSYEVPVNTSVRLNAYTISGTNHAIDEVTSAVTFKHDKTGLFSSFSANDVTASDNTVKYSKAGTYTVYAHHGEYTSPEITIKVVDASFEKVVINSSYTTVPTGQTIRLTATGFFYERDILKAVDVTNDVDWISGDPKVLTATNVKGQYKANLAGNSAININWKNLTDKLDFSVNNEPISSLVLVTSRKSMVIGSEQRISALAYYANGAAYDVSGQVSYNITPASAASIRVDAKDANVVWLTAKEAKPLTITASFTDTKRKAIDSINSVVIDVSDAVLTGLRIAPEKWSLGVGQNYVPSVVGIYNDGSNSDVTKQTSLSSSDTGVVTINNLGDGIHAEGVGSATITAKLGDIKATNNLKVEVKNSQTSISQIKLLATSGSLPVGGIKQQYSAVAVYANGETVDISNNPNIVWQIVGDNDVAQINARSGLLTTGSKAGDIRIQVDFAGKVDSVGLSVVDEKMVSLMISAAEVKLPLGNGLQYYAMAHYDSGKSQDVTSSVVWSSESPTVASIEPHSGKLTSLNPGSSNISASFNRADGVAVKSNILNLAVENKAVTRLVINAATSSLPIGGVTQQYKAFAYYDNGDVNDVTTSADINWSVSGASAAAAIDNLNYKGLLTTSAFTAGIVKINVRLNNIAATPVNLTVVDKQPRQLIISASESTLPIGINQQFKAYAVYDNFEQSDVTDQVSWSIDSSELATITPTGLVTTKSLGTAIVTASLPTTALLANSSLNIVKRKQLSLVLSPSHAILPIGLTQRYHAIAFYDNGESADVSSSVIWNSSVLDAATIDNGLATGVGSGNTVISASLNDQTVTGNLTINNATLKNVNVVPASLELALNTSYQLKAIGSYDNVTQQELSGCTWRSSSSAVTVDALSGAIRAQEIGNAVVTATCSGKEASSAISVVSASISSLQITPSTVTVAVGNTTNIYVVASYNNGNQQVLTGCTWTSDDAAIATVANGTVTGVANGNTTVKANCGGWNSEISAAVSVQAAVIKMVQITPKTLALPYKSQYQLQAIASYDNGTQGDITNSCQWSSNNNAVAGVDSNSGLVSAQSTSGNVQISASCANGSFSSAANVTVQAATLENITITPSSATMAVNTQQKLEVVGSYVNLDQALISEECAWSSSAPAIASVETTTAGSKGLVRGLTNGTADITATCPNAKSVKATIIVRSASLQRVLISPESINLPVNTGYQLNAVGTYDNMVQQTLTNCTWNKLTNSTASNLVVRESDGRILTTGNIAGTASIGVDCGGKVANARVTVGAKSLQSVKVSPSAITIPTTTSTSFEAIGAYNDGSSAVQASGCTWTSSDTTVATVSTLGKVSATSKSGNSTITATCGAFSSTGVVTVASRSLQSLQVSPAAVSIPVNTKYQLQAFGSYDDYSLEKIESCVWSRTSGTTTISVESTTGDVSAGTTAGSATIQASCGSKTANSTVTVNTKALNAITVTPSSKSLSVGESFALSVVGSYSDVSAGEVTSGCTWTSANTSIVTVDTNGVINTVAAGGPVNVTTSCSGKSNSAAITVNSASKLKALMNGSAITDIDVPVDIDLPIELSFQAESGNITNFELLSPSLNGMPIGWSSESSTQLKCTTISPSNNTCSVRLHYYPRSKARIYEGTLSIVYSYTNNLGQIKYETRMVKYRPTNRFAFFTTGGQRRVGRCIMDNDDKYIQTDTCTLLTLQDLNGNAITHNGGFTTGVNFYNGQLYVIYTWNRTTILYKCNINTSNTISCAQFTNNTGSSARGLFIDRFNIIAANASVNNFSLFSTVAPNSTSNLSLGVGALTNDIVVDPVSARLFASVATTGRYNVLNCAYNVVTGDISNCSTIAVPGQTGANNAYPWGIATYIESATSASHLYVTNASSGSSNTGTFPIVHCDISTGGSLSSCSNVDVRVNTLSHRFTTVSKIDIIDGIAYVMEHNSRGVGGYAIYQCDLLDPISWNCDHVSYSSVNPALNEVEMMAVTGRSN